MTIGEVSLTSGMRANLYSLQSTAKLLDITQKRLATGKKVNSALDNPTNFFAAQAHTNRASDLSSLKDGMSEAIQVIKAADQGISGITTMIEAAKGLAQAAQTSSNAYTTHTDLTFTNSIAVGDQVTINGVTFTAIDGSAGASTATTFAIGSGTYTGALAAAGLSSSIGLATTTLSASTISVSSGTITLSAAGSIEHYNVSENVDAVSVSNAGGTYARGETYDLATQYNTLMSQLDDLVTDSNYKGSSSNLLTTSGELVVNFEDAHSLTVSGFDATSSSLGADISTATSNWAAYANIVGDINKMDDALSTLRTESAQLSSNLGIITTRQDFTENMMNILKDGADNLTLADMNEEGANMLMLQTRQSLATTSLSLSSQAAQTVLRLF